MVHYKIINKVQRRAIMEELQYKKQKNKTYRNQKLYGKNKSSLSSILNVNGLNYSIKRQRLAGQIFKNTVHLYAVYKRLILNTKRLKVKARERCSMQIKRERVLELLYLCHIKLTKIIKNKKVTGDKNSIY